MTYSWLQKNLMVFLDLSGKTKEWHWILIKEKVPPVSELSRQTKDGTKIILCFDRLEILQYWFMLWKLAIYRRHFFTRAIFLIIEDGLFKFVYASDSKSYRTLRKVHNSSPLFLEKNQSRRVNLLEQLFFCIPLTLRASQRYILVELKTTVDSDLPSEIADLNHMFFSSPDKKLLLSNYETLLKGSGQLFKTTANVAYGVVMEKEYEIALSVSHLCSHSALLPEVSGRIEVNGRTYYHEEYVAGHSLTKKLRSPNTYKDTIAVCACIDQLDNWYGEYRSKFTGLKRSLKDLYAPIFEDYCKFFSADPEQCSLAEKVQSNFVRLHNFHSGLIPVIAHNDLWPANILVTAKGLVAIDWETASPNRSELFDYFWMIISTTLEYLSAPNGFDDFSRWFKSLLTSNDPVCVHARKKLEAHLQLNGISSGFLDLFIALFLMEFAIRGGLSLSRHTHMDILVAEEFRCFVKERL